MALAVLLDVGRKNVRSWGRFLLSDGHMALKISQTFAAAVIFTAFAMTTNGVLLRAFEPHSFLGGWLEGLGGALMVAGALAHRRWGNTQKHGTVFGWRRPRDEKECAQRLLLRGETLPLRIEDTLFGFFERSIDSGNRMACALCLAVVLGMLVGSTVGTHTQFLYGLVTGLSTPITLIFILIRWSSRMERMIDGRKKRVHLLEEHISTDQETQAWNRAPAARGMALACLDSAVPRILKGDAEQLNRLVSQWNTEEQVALNQRNAEEAEKQVEKREQARRMKLRDTLLKGPIPAPSSSTDACA